MTQQINLIDATLRQGRDWANGVVVLSALVVGCLAVAAHGMYEEWQWKQASMQVAAADAAREASGAAMQQVSAQVAQLQAQIAADDQMRRAAAAMVDPPQNCVARFEQLVGALAPNMWMQSVEFAGARGVHMLVNGLRQSDLAHYADGLSAAKAFAGLPIEILSIERKELSESSGGLDSEVKTKILPYYAFELRGSDSIAPVGGTP
ncbi:MAG: hypothetical protein KGL57_02550 [Burkholderiales bacterium]|nr:hypothetical protein [Burkholderiales bacterium]